MAPVGDAVPARARRARAATAFAGLAILRGATMSSPMEKNPDLLSYRELQQLAKRLSLGAGGKKVLAK